jgi:hypothetical protein
MGNIPPFMVLGDGFDNNVADWLAEAIDTKGSGGNK